MSSAVPQFCNSSYCKNQYLKRLCIEFCNSAVLQFYNSTIHKNTEHGFIVFILSSAVPQFYKLQKKKYLKRLHNEFCNSAVLQFYNFTNHKNTYHCLIKFKYSWFRNSAILHLYYIYICKYIYKYIYIYIFIPQFYMRNLKKNAF